MGEMFFVFTISFSDFDSPCLCLFDSLGSSFDGFGKYASLVGMTTGCSGTFFTVGALTAFFGMVSKTLRVVFSTCSTEWTDFKAVGESVFRDTATSDTSLLRRCFFFGFFWTVVEGVMRLPPSVGACITLSGDVVFAAFELPDLLDGGVEELSVCLLFQLSDAGVTIGLFSSEILVVLDWPGSSTGVWSTGRRALTLAGVGAGTGTALLDRE